MNTVLPFICLGLGMAINWRGQLKSYEKAVDLATSCALYLLMVIIGINIGANETVLGSIGQIGLRSLFLSFLAVCGSVAVVVLCEKTVMPLEKVRLQLAEERARSRRVQTEQNASDEGGALCREDEAFAGSDAKGGLSPILFLMPGFLALGAVLGFTLLGDKDLTWLDGVLTWTLAFLYTGVGVSLASNKGVFVYIKRLGWRVFIMPLAIFAGSLLGGLAGSFIVGMDTSVGVISTGGMGYYSLTGAFMTENYGIEAGVYGFLSNVFRDVFTVLLCPILVKISKGSPIASGAAGCMDSMLVPVAKTVGAELALVALISGTVLTFWVPVWLPMAKLIFG